MNTRRMLEASRMKVSVMLEGDKADNRQVR